MSSERVQFSDKPNKAKALLYNLPCSGMLGYLKGSRSQLRYQGQLDGGRCIGAFWFPWFFLNHILCVGPSLVNTWSLSFIVTQSFSCVLSSSNPLLLICAMNFINTHLFYSLLFSLYPRNKITEYNRWNHWFMPNVLRRIGHEYLILWI